METEKDKEKKGKFIQMEKKEDHHTILSIHEYLGLRVGWIMWHLFLVLIAAFLIGFVVGINW